MRRTIIIISLLLFVASCGVKNKLQNQEKDNNSNFKNWVNFKVDSVMKSNNIPAISISIIKNGNIIISKGFGIKNRVSKEKVNEESIYQIASDTKKMTGIIVKNLVMENKLDLDISITNYLQNSISESTKSKFSKITLRDILHHKSGLPYREPTTKREDGEPMLVPYTEEDLITDLNNVKLGEKKFSYSNFGYAIVGFICEKVSSLKYSELIDKYVSKKYKMLNTSINLNKNQLKRLVTPYRKNKRNIATKPFNMGKLSPAGGVFSCTKDLSILMLNQIKSYKNYSKPTPLILTNTSNEVDSEYGFGLSRKTFTRGNQYGHGGDLDGYASGYVFSPEYNAGVVILTSSGGKWIGELEKEIFYKLTDRKYSYPKKSLALKFYNIINKEGVETAISFFNKNEKSSNYYLKEQEMNNVGNIFYKNERFKISLEVFKLNSRLFSSYTNYEKIGDIYLKTGKNKLAKKNYEKALKIKPNNIEIRNKLSKLTKN